MLGAPGAGVRVEGRVGTADRPAAPTLIYDAACDFCRRWVRRARALDDADRVRWLPLQDPSASTLAAQPRERLTRAAHFVRPDGAVFAGAAAARELARYLRGGWILRALFGIPGGMWLGARAYAWVARRWGPVS